MDGAILSAVASLCSALAVVAGLFWTVKRARSTQARQAGRDLFAEMEKIIDLLKQELARREKEIDLAKRQNDWLARRNAKLMQVVSKAYNIPESVIDMQLNGGPPPTEARH